LSTDLANAIRIVFVRGRHPIWLYPNLLSLDAPLVAIAWLHVFAVSWRLYIPWQAYACLGLSTWVIYAADRLLDHRIAEVTDAALEPRHAFHRRHQLLFSIGMGIAALMAVTLVITSLPMAVYSNLLWASLLIGGFFGLSLNANREKDDGTLLKNIIAGFTFSFGTAMTASIYRPDFSMADLLCSPEFVLFALLCILNVSAIDIWEHSARSRDEEVQASDEISLTFPITLLAASALYFATQSDEERIFHYAILTAAGLMHILNRRRHTLSSNALRALADGTLLAPWLVFAVLPNQ
jgi:hypothetical protein